jgi:hypothetical protein
MCQKETRPFRAALSPRMTSVFQSYPISQIKISKRLVLRRSVIDASCCARSPISARPRTRLCSLRRCQRRRLLFRGGIPMRQLQFGNTGNTPTPYYRSESDA